MAGNSNLHMSRDAKEDEYYTDITLIEDLSDINLEGIDWLIVGGESGAGARKMGIKFRRQSI